MAFTPAQLNLPPGLPFERINSYNVISVPQRSGRALRRKITSRQLKRYRLVFLGVTCVVSTTPEEAILSVFPKPFNLQTPDDGTVVVRFLNDTLVILQRGPVTFDFNLEVQELF